MNEQIELENKVFMEALELMQQERDRILVWEQAFYTYLDTKYWQDHNWWDNCWSKPDSREYMINAYNWANQKLQEYIERGKYDEPIVERNNR